MRPLPSGQVFTVHEAHAAGWTGSALKNAVHRGHLIRVRRGVYTSADEHTPVVAAVAAARAVRDSVISHRSAALMHGLPLVGAGPVVPEVTVPPRAPANLPELHPYRATLRPEDVAFVGDVPVTSIARTLVDVARHRPLETAVPAIDAALFRQLVSVEQIEDVLRFCWDWPGIRRAQRAVRLADGRAESPLESVSRLVLPRLGVPQPALQTTIFDRFGLLIGRGDFYWDEFGVVGEADGRSKYDGRATLTAEKERQEDFENLGLVFVRWGWDHVTRRQHVLKGRVSTAFERGQRRDRSGFPRLWTL